MNAKIISEGGHSAGTTIMLPGGGELKGVRRAVFTAEAGKLALVDVEIGSATAEVEGKLAVYVGHPETGALDEVAKIVFRDGSEWVAP